MKKLFFADEFKELIGFNHTWLVALSVLVTGFSFPFIFLNGYENVIPQEKQFFFQGWIYAGVLHVVNLWVFYKFKQKDLLEGRVNSLISFFTRDYPVHILVTVVFSVLLTYIFFIIPDRVEAADIFSRCIIGTIILMSILVGFYESAFYMTALNKSIQETENLKRQNMQAQLDILRVQVQPHFLFNSLNTLVSIIPSEPNHAVKYVQNLSTVYRYVLETKNEKITEIENEITCVSAYLSMLETRFGANLRCNIHSDSFSKSDFIPPLTLQILAENAVKHNVVSEKKPLTIDIEREGDFLVVKNNLQPMLDKEPSTQTGLKNISDRYKLLGHEGFKILETKEHFKVFLPIIEINS